MPILAPTYSTLYRSDRITTYVVAFVIDMLDDYIRTPEVFRVVSEATGVPEGLPEPPGEVLGLIGPQWRGGGRPQEVPPKGVLIGKRGGGAA